MFYKKLKNQGWPGIADGFISVYLVSDNSSSFDLNLLSVYILDYKFTIINVKCSDVREKFRMLSDIEENMYVDKNIMLMKKNFGENFDG